MYVITSSLFASFFVILFETTKKPLECSNIHHKHKQPKKNKKMFRLRLSSSVVSSSALSKAVIGASPISTVRRYEYPAYGTYKALENAMGTQLPKCYEKGEVRIRDASALAQTGNSDIPVYDADTMYNPSARVEKDAQKFAMFRGNRTYAIDAVSDKQVRTACALFETIDTNKMWASLIKDYPSLATPLDAETKKVILSVFQQGLASVQNEQEVAELVRPVVLELLQTKFIHQPLWWRFSEKITEAMQAKAEGSFDRRAAILCTERFTKMLYNHSFETFAWASEDYVSPSHFDICGTRQCTEAGMW